MAPPPSAETDDGVPPDGRSAPFTGAPFDGGVPFDDGVPFEDGELGGIDDELPADKGA